MERVVPCGEQVNNREAEQPIVAWPISGRSVEAAQAEAELEAEEALFDLAADRSGLWRSCEFELTVGYESDSSEYSTAHETDDRSERSGRSERTDMRSDRLSARSSQRSSR